MFQYVLTELEIEITNCWYKRSRDTLNLKKLLCSSYWQSDFQKITTSYFDFVHPHSNACFRLLRIDSCSCFSRTGFMGHNNSRTFKDPWNVDSQDSKSEETRDRHMREQRNCYNRWFVYGEHNKSPLSIFFVFVRLVIPEDGRQSGFPVGALWILFNIGSSVGLLFSMIGSAWSRLIFIFISCLVFLLWSSVSDSVKTVPI